MKLLVIGSGMYVTGRGGTGHGTILSSIAEFSKGKEVQLLIYSKSEESAKDVDLAAERINALLSTRLKASFLSSDAATLDKVLAEGRFDAAIIAVPDHLHFELCRTVIQHSVPTLVVKPLTPTADEAIELTRLADRQNTYAAVEFHKRWDESNLVAKSKVSQQVLGQIDYIDVNYSQRIEIPTQVFRSWASQTNIFQYLGVHYVDLIYFLTGFLPSRVMAYGQYGILKSSGIDTFDSVHAAIVWKSPVTDERFYSHFNTNWIDPDRTSAMSDQKIKIVGTKGRLELDQKNRGVELVTAQGIQHVNPYFADFLMNPDGSYSFCGYGPKSITTFLRDVTAIQAGEASKASLDAQRPSFRSSVVSSVVVEKVNSSLRQKAQWLEIPDELWSTF